MEPDGQTIALAPRDRVVIPFADTPRYPRQPLAAKARTLPGVESLTLLFAPQPPVLAATSDGQSCSVRRLFCIGRNYAAHAREMGQDPDHA